MSKTKRILIRADGGPVLGLGHLMRCRSLALELRRLGWEPIFYGTTGAGSGPGPLVDESGHPLRHLAVDPDMDSHPGQGNDTARVAREWRVQVVLVDSYGFATADFLALQAAGVPVIALDDLGNRELPVDLVINPTPLVTPALYKWQSVAHVLAGEMFTIIRPEVLRVPRAGGLHEGGSLLVSLGGGDVADLLRRVLHALPTDPARPVIASVSPACSRHLLEIWAQSDPSRRALNHDPAIFPDLMGQAAFAVTGGGTTLWELYYIGVPGVVLLWVDNQWHTATVVRQRQTSLLLDVQAGFRPEPFREAVLRLWADPALAEQMIARQQALIDGQGARRLAEAIDHRYQ